MPLTLDHLFIITGPGAPEAELLTSAGLVEGGGNTHPGQGTANRRFFLANGMLELLFVADPDEAANGPGRRLRLAERAASRNTSPIGVIVRANSSREALLPGWDYRPVYAPDGDFYRIGENSDRLDEPLCVCLPPGAPSLQPRQDNPGLVLTDVRISVPVSEPSVPLQMVASAEGVSLQLRANHHLTLTLNHGAAGELRALSPELPLTLRW